MVSFKIDKESIIDYNLSFFFLYRTATYFAQVDTTEKLICTLP